MTIGEVSDVLAWGAATAYCVAMVAFAVDLSRARTEEHFEKKNKAAGIAIATTTLGALLHLGSVVTRALGPGRAPWGNMYEFALTGTLVATIVLLVVLRMRKARYLGVFVTGIVVLLLVLALRVWHVEADQLQPALQNYWLVLHVGVAVLATGIFTVAFVLAVLQLMRDYRDAGSPRLVKWQWLGALPNPVRLEALCFRLNAVGFVLWTFTLIGGAIWAEEAWGRYWGWDAKEVWSFIVWVVYAAYLHARSTRGWAGRPAAWFVVVGYACVLFNFTGVNLFLSEKHGYG